MRELKDQRAALLEHLLLAEPVTERGIEHISHLRGKNKIRSLDFYKLLYVSHSRANDIGYKEIEEIDERLYGEYEPTEENEQAYTDHYSKLSKRLNGPSLDHLIVLMGVVGNGKSVEARSELRKLLRTKGNQLLVPFCCRDSNDLRKEWSTSSIVIDLEDVPMTCPLPHDKKNYTAPNSNALLWLFLTKLINTFRYYLYYIENDIDGLKKACEVFKTRFADTDSMEGFESGFFIEIEKYLSNQTERMRNVILYVVDLLDSYKYQLSYNHEQDVKDNMELAKSEIEKVLKLLFLLIACYKQEANGYIVVDNIEDYIKVSGKAIQIADSEVAELYTILRKFQNSWRQTWRDLPIMNDEESKAMYPCDIQIVLVLRRTTETMLETYRAGDFNSYIGDIFDITGSISLVDVWNKKKPFVWEKYKDKYTNEEKDFVSFADSVLQEGNGAIGKPLQLLLAGILSHGLRRIARCSAIIFLNIYNTLTLPKKPNKPECISFSIHKSLFEKHQPSSYGTTQYLYRYASMEFFFRHIISQHYWDNLNIGHIKASSRIDTLLNADGEQNKNKVRGIYYNVDYKDKQNISYLRRILSVLSYEREDSGLYSSLVPSFSMFSLYDLMRTLFVNPNGDLMKKVAEKSIYPFRLLAKILLCSSGLPSESDCSPLTLLHLKENDSKNEDVFAVKLKKIWNAGWSMENNEGDYDQELLDKMNYGIRLSEAGYLFLQDWQPSFTFFSALYCHGQPPLYFIKDKFFIIHIIATVYKNAEALCNQYDSELNRFYGDSDNENISQFVQDSPLFPQNNYGSGISFRSRVVDLHRNYLSMYLKHLDVKHKEIGIKDEDFKDIKTAITNYLEKYKTLNGSDVDYFNEAE